MSEIRKRLEEILSTATPDNAPLPVTIAGGSGHGTGFGNITTIGNVSDTINLIACDFAAVHQILAALAEVREVHHD